MKHVTGSFDVKMVPQAGDEAGGSPAVGRMLIDKAFHGPLEGISKGQMLSAGDYSKGSAGYVAIEAVTGTLDGKKGGFALQHSGTMDQGASSLLSITHKFRAEDEAELYVGEAGHSAPHDSVSWRRIFGASKVASEAGNFGQVQGELIAGESGTGWIAYQLIQ